MNNRWESLETRFWKSFVIDVETLCWEWQLVLTGSSVKEGRGYGQIRVNGITTPAHRVAYELVKGPIPNGLVIDHLCRNTKCVNPDHLEPVTQKVNQERSERATKLYCVKGHPLDGITKRKALKYPQRFCKTCLREYGRKA